MGVKSRASNTASNCVSPIRIHSIKDGQDGGQISEIPKSDKSQFRQHPRN